MNTMNKLFYISLIPFTMSLIATGILVYLALQNGLVIQWVAVAAFGLADLLLLFRIGVSYKIWRNAHSSDSNCKEEVKDHA
jgi:hypothetical protein